MLDGSGVAGGQHSVHGLVAEPGMQRCQLAGICWCATVVDVHATPVVCRWLMKHCNELYCTPWGTVR